MKKKFISKLILMTITGAICINAIAPSVSAITYEKNNKNIETNIINNPENYKDYIKIVDGKYVLNNSSKLKNIEIKQLQKQLDFTNNIIEKYNIKNISIEDGFTIEINDYEISKQLIEKGYDIPPAIQKAGVTKVKFYWWGFYLYLSSYWTGLAIAGGVAAITAGIGSILGPGVAVAVAVAVSGAVVDYVMSNSAVGKRGCVVSWNYALGLQDIWAQ